MNGFNQRDGVCGQAATIVRLHLFVILAIAATVISINTSFVFAQTNAEDAAVDKVYADGPVAVRLSLEHTKVTTPGQLRLSFIFTFEEGVEVQAPEFDRTLGGFLVVSQERAEPNTLRGVTTFAVHLTLESALPGTAELGPFEFRYRDTRESAADADVHVVSTEPIVVQVVSGLADVAGPVELPTPMWRLVMQWGIAALAGVVMIWFVVARMLPALRRRSAEVSLPPGVAPDAWAMGELDTLAGEVERRQLSPRDYHFRINAILRDYIQRRFGIKAGEQTSEELLAAVQREATFEPTHREMLDRFVRACDPVKYAAQEADDEAIRRLDLTAREFVAETSKTGLASDSSGQGDSRAGR